MQYERLDTAAKADCSVSKDTSLVETVTLSGKYQAECYGPVESMRQQYVALRDRLANLGFLGRIFLKKQLELALAAIPMEPKWADEIKNLVTTVGKTEILEKYLAGSAYTAAVVMGLKGTGAAAVGDTQASHAGWLEVGTANAPTYTGPRKTPSFSAASAGSKTTSAAVAFAITGAGTVAGCFINQGGSSAIDNTTGTLYSAGDFTGGSKTVDNGDTINVTYTATA